MSAVLQAYASDGVTGIGQQDLGMVTPGTSNATPPVVLCKNTGDAAASSVSVHITQVGNEDMEDWLSLTVQQVNASGTNVGSALTCTFASPAVVGALPAGYALKITLGATVPSNASLSSDALLSFLEVWWGQ